MTRGRWLPSKGNITSWGAMWNAAQPAAAKQSRVAVATMRSELARTSHENSGIWFQLGK